MNRTPLAIALVVIAIAGCKPKPETPATETDTGSTVDAIATVASDAVAAIVADAESEASADADAAAPVDTDGGQDKNMVTIDVSSAGKTIDLARGQKLVVSLKANPGSGYDWNVVKAPPALGTPEKTFIGPGGETLGAMGQRKLTFTLKDALPAGEHAVELGYSRSFEPGKPPVRTFAFKVRAAR